MLTSRKFACMDAAEGKLYVLGGRDKSTDFMSVESYDPATNGWVAVPEMSLTSARCSAACVSM